MQVLIPGAAPPVPGVLQSCTSFPNGPTGKGYPPRELLAKLIAFELGAKPESWSKKWTPVLGTDKVGQEHVFLKCKSCDQEGRAA